MSDLDLVTLPAEQRDGARRAGESVEYADGDVLFYAGHQPYGAYFIESGRVRLSGRRAAGEAGPGDLLGFDACAAAHPHRHTATAEGAVRVCFVPRRLLARAFGSAAARARARAG